MFVLAQISGFLAWLSLLISYYRKNTNKILVFHILSIVFYLLNYVFLGAWAGIFIIAVELIRDSLYYKTDKDNLIFLLTIPIYILLFIVYRNDFVELIPIVASLFEGFTLTKKKSVVVPGALIVYSMWVVYDISVGAYTGALTDGLIVISNIGILINMIKGYKKVDSFKISSRYSITKESIEKIDLLKVQIDKLYIEKNKIDQEQYILKQHPEFVSRDFVEIDYPSGSCMIADKSLWKLIDFLKEIFINTIPLCKEELFASKRGYSQTCLAAGSLAMWLEDAPIINKYNVFDIILFTLSIIILLFFSVFIYYLIILI